MKYKIIVILLLIFNFSSAQNDLNNHDIENINKLVNAFKTKDIHTIANMVNYPLKRENPIPDVINSIDFKKRFNQIFDDKIISTISNSKINQWSKVGWRGIMLDNGSVWLEPDGKLNALNYQSDFEIKQKNNLIEQQKTKLHASLKSFSKPIYKFKTKNYLVRIDELNDKKYRYSSWKLGKPETSKPDIIIYNGVWENDGSGGSHTISFKSGLYKYIIYRAIISNPDAAEITLTIDKNSKSILHQDGELLQ